MLLPFRRFILIDSDSFSLSCIGRPSAMLPPLVDGIALPDFPGVLDDVMLAGMISGDTEPPIASTPTNICGLRGTRNVAISTAISASN